MTCDKKVELEPRGFVVTYCEAQQGHEGPCRPNISIASMYGVMVQSGVEASPKNLGVK